MAVDCGDRYEFINAVIGWLGYDELYLDILKCSNDELNDYIQDESERFEELLSVELSKFSLKELNDLSKKYNLNYEVINI